MDFERRGVLQPAALAGAVLVLVGVLAVVGFAMADTSPTGTEVLSDVENQYQSADSVLVEANVTVEKNGSVTEFTVHSVATSDGQMRTNVSNGTQHLLFGHTGNTTWVTDSKTGATIVVSSAASPNQSSMTGLGNPALQTFRTTTQGPDNETLSVWLFGLENATLDAFQGEWNRSEGFGGLNDSMAPGDWNSSSHPPLSANWTRNGSHSVNWSSVGSHGHELNGTHAFETWENKSLATLLEETNLTADFVETTTLEDHRAHVVVVSNPERAGQVKIWADADTATVLKYRVRTPNGTITVDIQETRFNISPAASTFQPPLASDTDRTSVDSLSDLQDAAPVSVGVPSDNWTFVGGSVMASPIETVIGQYEANGSDIVVIQSRSRTVQEFAAAGRTVSLDDRNVTVVDVSEGPTIARWSQNDQTVIVTGEVSESELLKFVRDLEFESAAP